MSRRVVYCFSFRIRPPPRSTRSHTLFPYTAPSRSASQSPSGRYGRIRFRRQGVARIDSSNVAAQRRHGLDEQSFLRLEVAIDRHLRHARGFGDGIHAGAIEAVTQENIAGGLNDLCAFGCALRHARVALRPSLQSAHDLPSLIRPRSEEHTSELQSLM